MVSHLKFLIIPVIAVWAVTHAPASQAKTPPTTIADCTDVVYSSESDVITANCLYIAWDPNGPYNQKYYLNSALPDASACVGDIINVNGNLACTQPGGSWSESCKNFSIDPLSGQSIAFCLSTGFSGYNFKVGPASGLLTNCTDLDKNGNLLPYLRRNRHCEPAQGDN